MKKTTIVILQGIIKYECVNCLGLYKTQKSAEALDVDILNDLPYTDITELVKQ